MRIERQVLFWLAAVILLVVAVLVLQAVLLPFVAGLVVAYALNPIAERLVTLGMPRLLASALIVALLLIVLTLALFFLVPLLLDQVQQLAVSAPKELERARTLLENWARERLGSQFEPFRAGLDRAASELSNNWGSVAGVVAQSVWSQGRALVGFLSLLLITPLVVFYLLVDWHPMLAKIDGWLPRDHAPAIRRVAGEIDDAIAAFIRGQGLVCLILGVLYAAGLTWAGIRYGLLIGVVTGILSFIPFVGWALGLLTSSAVAIVQFWPETTPLLKVIGVFALAQVLDAAFLGPRIVGPKIGLHPVWLIFALFVFSSLFGVVGVLVAVPVAAAIAVLIRFGLEVYLGSSIYRGRDAGLSGSENTGGRQSP
jgi:predicted PurR-regulated permease PerM